ncbi:MAG TPA: hypothetical protein VKJ65_00100 [Phycisphaerae bacterium]|nr:hypothetical protein [Phycisphaerae bacterium]
MTDHSRLTHINWFSIAAVVCLIGEAIFLAQNQPSINQPPSIIAIVLTLMTLFLGSGAIIYRIQDKQHWLLGRWLGIGAMLAATLLLTFQSVALHAAREREQFAHMQGIAEACNEYAQANGGSFPPNLAVLLIEHKIVPATLSDPTNILTPLELPPNWEKVKPDVLAAAISRNSDFRYTGFGLHVPGDTDSAKLMGGIILLFTNDQDVTRGGPLAFADGTVRFVPADQLIPTLDDSNAARKELGLPSFTFDSLLPGDAESTTERATTSPASTTNP